FIFHPGIINRNKGKNVNILVRKSRRIKLEQNSSASSASSADKKRSVENVFFGNFKETFLDKCGKVACVLSCFVVEFVLTEFPGLLQSQQRGDFYEVSKM
ncbi:MAG: hypothetical protein Q4E67_06715, partial [Planctomycetia bacterium]|nr:hypothetical protein [Planctomycetia bacterium]